MAFILTILILAIFGGSVYLMKKYVITKLLEQVFGTNEIPDIILWIFSLAATVIVSVLFGVVYVFSFIATL